MVIAKSLVSHFSQNRITLNPAECIRDSTFEWATRQNIWLNENVRGRKNYMIAMGCLMDLMIGVAVSNWAYRHRTARLIPTMILFYWIRGKVQNHFFIARPVGFLWTYPDWPSIAIAYFDTSDFYFSGHIGNCTMFMLENWALGEKKIAALVLFVMVNEWIGLTLLRAHFVIDMIMGFFCANLVHRVSEHIAFIYDVKIAGF
jgi:hypothetical protein